MDNGNRSASFKNRFHKQLFALVALCMLLAPFMFSLTALAQTQVPPPGSDFASPNAGDTSPGASQTQATAKNIYDAPGQTTLVQQQAEQNTEAVAQNVEQQLWPDFGAYNDTYQGLSAFWGDDIISNFFANIGQLIGKWLSEFINGWVADAVQFLTGFLRIFVLNPNIAVNGLSNVPGGQGAAIDDISPYVRQGADIMYGIAIDLLLLLFILCIWKYWAEAAWRGGGNMMGAVGRLIFTSGLLLAWPTIYAFEIQITNEMIKALYFNSADQVAMLDAAMAAAVKGGLVAGAGLLANATAPVAGQVLGGILGGGAGGIVLGTVGSLVAFVGLIIYLVLGGILIAELIYILVLKAIQTALLTAQYMFAPLFLVFFALPDTENVCSGFVRSFVEVSLWTFVWVGMLKIMVIVVLSDFNPWGKIVMAVGVLQLMIQVPSFLARAQISPMSDFISAGLITGGLLSGGKALGGMLGDRAKHFANAVGNFGYAGAKGAPKSQSVELNGLESDVANPGLLKDIRSAASTGKVPGKGDKPPGGPGGDKTVKPPEGPKGPKDGKGPGMGPDGKPLNPTDPLGAKGAKGDGSAPGTDGAVVPPANKPVNPADKTTAESLASAAKTGTTVAATAAVLGAGMAAMGANGALSTKDDNHGTGDQTGKDLSAQQLAETTKATGNLVNAAGNLVDSKTGKELLDGKGQPIKGTVPPAAGDKGKAGEVVKDQATVSAKIADGKDGNKATGPEATAKGKDLATGISPADLAKTGGVGTNQDGASLKTAGDEVEVTGTGDDASKVVASSVVPGMKVANANAGGNTPGNNLNADGSTKSTVDGGKGGAGKLETIKGETNVVPKPGANPVTGTSDKSVVPPINSSQLATATGAVATGKAIDPTTAIVSGDETLNPADPGAPVVTDAKEGTFNNKSSNLGTAAVTAASVVAATALKNGTTPPAAQTKGDGKVETTVNGKVVGGDQKGAPGSVIPPVGGNLQTNANGQTTANPNLNPNSSVTAVTELAEEGAVAATAAALTTTALSSTNVSGGPLKDGTGNLNATTSATTATTSGKIVPPVTGGKVETAVNGKVVGGDQKTSPTSVVPPLAGNLQTNASGQNLANPNANPNASTVTTAVTELAEEGAATGVAAALTTGINSTNVSGSAVKNDPSATNLNTTGTATTNATGKIVPPGTAQPVVQAQVTSQQVAGNKGATPLVPPMNLGASGQATNVPGTGATPVVAPINATELLEEGLETAGVVAAANVVRNAATGGNVNKPVDTAATGATTTTTSATGRIVPPATGTAQVNTVVTPNKGGTTGAPPAGTQTQFAATAGGSGSAPPVAGAKSFADGGDGGDGGDDGGAGGGGGGIPPGGPAAQPSAPNNGQKASMFDGYMQAGYRHVPYRVAAAAIRLAQGATLGVSRSGRPENIYDNQGHMMHVRFGEGASDEQKGMQIMAGAYGELMSSDAEAYDAARQSSIDAGEHKPQGMAERAAAGILAYNGSSWTQTAAAKQRFARSMSKHAALGAQSYVNGEEGNAYTEHLVNRYGPMSEDQQAWAAHIMTSTDSPESGWSWRMGPATDALIQSGLPISPVNRAVAANQNVLKSQPWLRGASIRGGAEYMQSRARAEIPEGTNGLVQDAWYGNRAQAMPAEVVNTLGALTLAGVVDDEGNSVCRDFGMVDQVAAMVGPGAKPEDYVGAYNTLRGGSKVMAHFAGPSSRGGGGGGGNVNLGSVNMGGGGGGGGGGYSGGVTLGGVTTSGGGSGGGGGGGGTADVDLFLDGPTAGATHINPNSIPLPNNLPTMQGGAGSTTVNARLQPPPNQGGGGNVNLGSIKVPGGNVGSSSGGIQIGRVDGPSNSGGGGSQTENVSIDVEQSVSGQVLDSGGLQSAAVSSAVSQFGGSQNLVKQVVADLRANGMDWKQIYDPTKDDNDPGKYQMLETAVQAYSQNPESMPAVAVAANAVGASNVSMSDVQVVQSMFDADPKWTQNNMDYGAVYTARAINDAHQTDPQTYGQAYLTKDYVDSVRQDPRFVPRPVPVRDSSGQVARYDQSPVPKDRLVKRMMERMLGQDGYNNGNG